MKVKALVLTALTLIASLQITPKAHAHGDGAAIVAGALALGLGIAAARERRHFDVDDRYYHRRFRHERRFYRRHHHSRFYRDEYPEHWEYPVNPPYTVYRRW